MRFNTINHGVEVKVSTDRASEIGPTPFHLVAYTNGQTFVLGHYATQLSAEFAAEDLENLLACAYVRGESDATRRVACG